ncbi:hypothetical protein Leryth_019957, partial [Lithospermum erythrorhizon]
MTKPKPKATGVSTKSKTISKSNPKSKGPPPSQSLICEPSSQDLIPRKIVMLDIPDMWTLVYVTRGGYTKGEDDFSFPREARDLGIFPTIRGASDRTHYASCQLNAQIAIPSFLYQNVIYYLCYYCKRSKDIYLMSKLIKGRGPTHISWAGTVIAHMLEFVRNTHQLVFLFMLTLSSRFSFGVKILDDEYDNKEFSNLVSIDTLKSDILCRDLMGVDKGSLAIPSRPLTVTVRTPVSLVSIQSQ